MNPETSERVAAWVAVILLAALIWLIAVLLVAVTRWVL